MINAEGAAKGTTGQSLVRTVCLFDGRVVEESADPAQTAAPGSRETDRFMDADLPWLPNSLRSTTG